MQKINWDKFIEAQKQLDKNIFDNKQLDYPSTLSARKLALIVELYEFINETKSFKFWSSSSFDREKLLMEYIDILHFTLSLSVNYEIKLPETDFSFAPFSNKDEMVQYFLKLTGNLLNFLDKETFLNWFNSFVEIGAKCGFNYSEIEEAYFKKLNINFQRQKDNY